MKTSLKILPVAMLMTWGSAKAACPDYSCSPQCVVYARDWLYCGFQVSNVGDPIGWLTKAKQAGKTASTPKAGRVLVLTLGHAICIQSAKRVGQTNRFELVIAHSNMDCHCKIEPGISAKYNADTRKFTFLAGKWSGQSYSVSGIITQ